MLNLPMFYIKFHQSTREIPPYLRVPISYKGSSNLAFIIYNPLLK